MCNQLLNKNSLRTSLSFTTVWRNQCLKQNSEKIVISDTFRSTVEEIPLEINNFENLSYFENSCSMYSRNILGKIFIVYKNIRPVVCYSFGIQYLSKPSISANYPVLLRAALLNGVMWCYLCVDVCSRYRHGLSITNYVAEEQHYPSQYWMLCDTVTWRMKHKTQRETTCATLPCKIIHV